ncbi:TlpA family protein disulfide reductase [Bacillus sp. FJAT-44742]|uniref:TlpA family protein disulfide reductase n=1 Tax=Bacillus sp. FJAT-44742 TaxID=2014005 RepID=UPI000C23ABDE|nr:hypothetical protein [Bacillus sp. FJAT-44742]
MEQFLLYSHILLWLIQVLVLFLIFLLYRQFGEVYVRPASSVSKDGLQIGERLPAVESVESLHAQNKPIIIHPAEEKPTLILFASQSCKACTDLIPHWNMMRSKHETNVNFITVFLGKKEKEAAAQEWDGDLLFDPAAELFSACHVKVTPFAFMTDEKRMIIDKGLCNNEKHLTKLLSSLEK